MDTKDITKEIKLIEDNLYLDNDGNVYSNPETVAELMILYHQSQSKQMRDRIVELEGVLKVLLEEKYCSISGEEIIKTVLNNKQK